MPGFAPSRWRSRSNGNEIADVLPEGGFGGADPAAEPAIWSNSRMGDYESVDPAILLPRGETNT